LTCGLVASAAAAAEGADAKPTWLLDAHAGVPKLSSGDFRVAGDGMAGYSAPSFGLLARGAVSYLTSDLSVGDQEDARYGAQGEGWYVTGAPGEKARFEARLSAGYAGYYSDYLPRSGLTTAVTGYFHSEDSDTWRGAALVGARLRPHPTLSASVLAGGGFLHEWYTYVKTDPRDKSLLADTTQTSARVEGRLGVRWRFVPEVVSARLTGEGAYFRITREDFIARIGARNQVSVVTPVTKMSQVEARARLFVEVDRLAFFEIVPSVFAGLDYFRSGSESGSASTLVPLFGVGLYKPVE
jgi:hypothetical protein